MAFFYMRNGQGCSAINYRTSDTDRTESTIRTIHRNTGMCLFAKQIDVSACTLKAHRIPVYFVDQQPIRLDMQITIAFPIALKRMIQIGHRKRYFLGKQPQWLFEFFQILAALFSQLYVALELAGVFRFHY